MTNKIVISLYIVVLFLATVMRRLHTAIFRALLLLFLNTVLRIKTKNFVTQKSVCGHDKTAGADRQYDYRSI
jgi:hypothetical protein